MCVRVDVGVQVGLCEWGPCISECGVCIRDVCMCKCDCPWGVQASVCTSPHSACPAC